MRLHGRLVDHFSASRQSATWCAIESGAPFGQSTYPAGVVPVRDVDVSLAIDEAAVGGTEAGRIDGGGIDIVVGPLRLQRIIAEKCDRYVVVIEDSDASFEFRDDGVVAEKADLAGATEVLRDGVDVFAVKIEVAEAAIFAIANEQKRLAVARIKGEPVAAVQHAGL